MQKQQLKSVSTDEKSIILPEIDEHRYRLGEIPSANNLFLISKGVVGMSVCEIYEQQIELASYVFKTQDKALINDLKNFLTILPSAKDVEEVLLAATYQLAETDSNACRWVLRNFSCLKPEVDLALVAKKYVLAKLLNKNFVLDQDFRFEPEAQLLVNKKALVELTVGNSFWETLLLEEIIQVQNLT